MHHEMAGVAAQPSIDPKAAARIRELRRRRKSHSAGDYIEAILAGDRVMLGQAITLVESSLIEHRRLAREIVEGVVGHSGRSFRIGITGVPGVGKSTFIESFGMSLIAAGYRPAVLAIDPSSASSGGSILGDKTRMARLSSHDKAFIRPSPSAGSLGGVARKSRECMLLCEAAGFDLILVETVGVGQSEVAVHSMCDLFLLLMLAGAGDELQGIKRGIMEMADLLTITKADGQNLHRAELARSEYERSLMLLPPRSSGARAAVTTCSALTGDGVEALLELAISQLVAERESGRLSAKRDQQSLHWMEEMIEDELRRSFYGSTEVSRALDMVRASLSAKEISPYGAADLLIERWRGER